MRQIVALPFFVLGISAASLTWLACNSSPPSSTANGDDGGGSSAFSYSPQGCSYTVSPPASLALTDLALDDSKTQVDATSGAPERVRLGVGGGTSLGKPGYADPSTTATFTWQTSGKNAAAKVKLGTDPNSLSDMHAGYSWT